MVITQLYSFHGRVGTHKAFSLVAYSATNDNDDCHTGMTQCLASVAVSLVSIGIKRSLMKLTDPSLSTMHPLISVL